MRRRAFITVILLLSAGTAPAARLCRDTKGLFTPCIGEPSPPEHHRRPRAAAPADVEPASRETATRSARAEPGDRSEAAGGASAGGSAKHASSRPPLVATAKLCRDSKGLFTPCAR